VQAYSAYTPYLDALTAGKFAAPNAPALLVHRLLGIDGRHIILDDPLTWRTILGRYHLVWWGETEDLLLLRASAAASEPSKRVLGESNLRFDEWTSIPHGKGLMFAEAVFTLKLKGQIAKALYRVPALYLELWYPDGRTERYRLVADTARNGLLVAPLPSDLAQLRLLFEHGRLPRAEQMRVTGGTRFYRDGALLRWIEQPPLSGG
jgi:hypothetical protein